MTPAIITIIFFIISSKLISSPYILLFTIVTLNHIHNVENWTIHYVKCTIFVLSWTIFTILSFSTVLHVLFFVLFYVVSLPCSLFPQSWRPSMRTVPPFPLYSLTTSWKVSVSPSRSPGGTDLMIHSTLPCPHKETCPITWRSTSWHVYHCLRATLTPLFVSPSPSLPPM